MKLNKIIITILFIMLIKTVSADVITLVEIPYTDTESTFQIKDLINAELDTDPANTITEISVITKSNQISGTLQSGGQATVQMTFNNESVIYTGQKSTYNLWVVALTYISHTLVANNTTIFSINGTTPQLPSVFKMNVLYDETTGNNTYSVYSMEKWLSGGQTNPVRALPAKQIRIQSDVPFDVYIVYSNPEEIAQREEDLQSMNGILGAIASYADKLLPVWATNALFPLLRFLDIILSIMELVISAVYTYPYLLIIWYMTFLNVYVSFKTETFSDFLIKWVQSAWVGIEWGIRTIIQIGYAIIWILKLVRQILQI